MEIRLIMDSELEELLDLYRYLHDADDPLPEPAVVRAVWERIQSDPHQCYFGAYVDDRLVSSCVLAVIPNLTRCCRPYGVIENVVTHGEYRRRGIGRRVLQAALAHAWSLGCYKVMLLTGRRTEGIFQFYESAGFDRHAKQAFLAKPATAQEPAAVETRPVDGDE
jgi:GNAT superfamily N-acetyltransferase